MADTERKCDICGKKFENSDKLIQHKQESHKEKEAKVKKKGTQSSRYKVTGVAAIIAVIAIIAVYASENQAPSPSDVEGVKCEPSESNVFHIHAHLDLIVDSKLVSIPAGIGIKPNECLYWVHTHTSDGIIHIESPEQRTFTLAQFVGVWNNTPNMSTKFSDLTKNDPNLKVFVNGKLVSGGFDQVKLSAHDEIVIVSGPVPPSIPSTFDFGGL